MHTNVEHTLEFTMDDHKIYYQAFREDGEWEQNVEMTPFEAVALATGQPGTKETVESRIAETTGATAAPEAAPPAQPQEAPAAAPAPAPGSAPPGQIDTSLQAPQVDQLVWKRHSWRSWGIGAWNLAILFFIIMIAEGAPGLFLLSIAFLVVGWYLKRKGRETMRLGVDKQANTLWATRSDQLVAQAPEANTIARLDSFYVRPEKNQGIWAYDHHVVAHRTSGDPEQIDGLTLCSGTEARRLLRKANELLQMQR
jgi:hypothetical protein